MIILLPVRSRAFRSCRGTCAAFSIELDCTKRIMLHYSLVQYLLPMLVL